MVKGVSCRCFGEEDVKRGREGSAVKDKLVWALGLRIYGRLSWMDWYMLSLGQISTYNFLVLGNLVADQRVVVLSLLGCSRGALAASPRLAFTTDWTAHKGQFRRVMDALNTLGPLCSRRIEPHFKKLELCILFVHLQRHRTISSGCVY